jgi:hypothetical protein
MINNTPGSKLDETVKSTLDSYEAPYDASDWSRMESMLDAAPKSNSFKLSHAITIIAGVAVLAGGYALYNTFGHSGTKSVELNSTPPPAPAAVKESPKVIVTPPPAVISSADTSAPVKEEAAATEKIIETPPAIAAKKEEKVTTAETKAKAKKEKNKKEAPIIDSHDKIIGMGNEPVFGDMLDSSKGIIGNTHEKEETKKAAKAKKGNVSWDIFTPHMNVDSMRKVREQRDSLKTQ